MRIKLNNNYFSVNNPFMRNKNKKQQFLYIVFRKYISLRLLLMGVFPRIFPVNEGKKNIWEDFDARRFHIDNSARYGMDSNRNQKVAAEFNLERLILFELFPKEQYESIYNGIRRFAMKHGKIHSIYSAKLRNEFNSIHAFREGSFQSLIVMSIGNNDRLIDVVKTIEFEMIVATNSLCCLTAKIEISNELKQNLSEYITGDVITNIDIVSTDDVRWYEFEKFGKTENSGSTEKLIIQSEIINEVKWRIIKSLRKFVPGLILSSNDINVPSISCFVSNVDNNDYPEFWNTILLGKEFCDFTKDYSGCLAWARYDSNLNYIYNNRGSWENGIIPYYLQYYLYDFLIADTIIDALRKKHLIINDKIQTLKRKRIDKWLEYKLKLDMELQYLIRFIYEYKPNKNKYKNFIRWEKSKQPIIEEFNYNNNKGIEELKRQHESLITLYKSNTDYRYAEESLRIQKMTLTTTYLSIMVAIIALILSVQVGMRLDSSYENIASILQRLITSIVYK